MWVKTTNNEQLKKIIGEINAIKETNHLTALAGDFFYIFYIYF